MDEITKLRRGRATWMVTSAALVVMNMFNLVFYLHARGATLRAREAYVDYIHAMETDDQVGGIAALLRERNAWEDLDNPF